MQVRLITEIGLRVSLRRYWGDTSDGKRPCPGTTGKSFGYHNAHLYLFDKRDPPAVQGGIIGPAEKLLEGGKPPDEDPRWLMRCDGCGEESPWAAARQVFGERLYDTPSGKPEPGTLRWSAWLHDVDADGRIRCLFWDNCTDPRGHLLAVCPNGFDYWDIDGRASNCTMKDDRVHRCWIRNGEPPAVHVDKNGHTCAAGAGSIAVAGYHGFLHNGAFTSC